MEAECKEAERVEAECEKEAERVEAEHKKEAERVEAEHNKKTVGLMAQLMKLCQQHLSCLRRCFCFSS